MIRLRNLPVKPSRRLRYWSIPLLAACILSLTMAIRPSTATPFGTVTGNAALTLSSNSLPVAPHTVTLITGDQITLRSASAAQGSHYAVSVDMAPHGFTRSVHILDNHAASGVDGITALPDDAAPFIASGSVDRGLFDVTYLAHQSDLSSGRLPVVVQFASPMTGAQLASQAASLPASTLIQTVDASNAVEVNVNLKDAVAFWAAVTGLPSTSVSGSSSTLANGIAKIWLKDHLQDAITPPALPSTVPFYTLTEIIHGRSDSDPLGCSVCYDWPPSLGNVLYGVQGPWAGQLIATRNVTCIDGNQAFGGVCHTAQAVFRVPAGVYSANNLVWFDSGNTRQWVEANNPEVRVASDTQISFDLNTAVKVNIHAPDPLDAYSAVFGWDRTLPDGSGINLFTISSYGMLNVWAVPTQPVTFGSYVLKTNWQLGEPLLTASVSTPQPLTLHPMYERTFTPWIARFSGRQSLALVDAGDGSSADFAKVDARGKLALIHFGNGSGGSSSAMIAYIQSWQLQNALQAGVAGLLVDPSDPNATEGPTYWELPVFPYWDGQDDPDHIKVPFAGISHSEASALRNLLSHGSTSITIDDAGETAYEYDLTFAQQGYVPASLDYIVTSKQLAATDSKYHNAQPAAVLESYGNWLPEESLAVTPNQLFPAPSSRKTYIGPVSPNLVYFQDASTYAMPLPFAPSQQTALAYSSKLAVYSQAGALGTVNWGDIPLTPGSPALDTDVQQAQPGRWTGDGAWDLCSACRLGNTFLPWMLLTSSDPQQSNVDMFTYWAGLFPFNVHLYQGGQEISPASNPFGVSEYVLSTGEAQYRLTLDDPTVHTTWNFTSAAPTSDQTPPGTYCPGPLIRVHGPCQAVPLIFLRYGAGADLNNTIAAPSGHQIQITAYHQTPGAPAITGMKVWISIDGEMTWQPAMALLDQGGGVYTATYTVPLVSASSGAVSLKVQAQDAGGNDVTQIIDNAYSLSPAQQ